MINRLAIKAIVLFFTGLAIISLLIFLPAGTLLYWNAWLLLGILFVPMLIVGIVLLYKNPGLLRRRLQSREKHGEQKLIVSLSGIMFVVGFICAGLDFRYNWLPLPDWISIAAVFLFLLGYLLYAIVLKQNTYLMRTVEVEVNQKVISTGMYSVIRHPMYASTILLFLSMPLVLGSVISLAVFLVYPFVIVARIKYEEEVLEKELEGYTEYKKQVKYKLIPFIW